MIKSSIQYKAPPSKVQGDALQQGGTFIIGPGDKLHYAHINQQTGDHGNNEEILKALEQ